MKNIIEITKQISSNLIESRRYRTARAYVTTVRSFKLFLGHMPMLDNIYAEQIRNYEQWLKNRGLSPNTISFYMRNLRAIYNRTVKMQLTIPSQENIFSEVYTGVAQTAKRALREKEMKSLVNLYPLMSLNGEDKDYAFALRIFLFCFYAQGMSFADAVFLKKSAIQGNIIIYRRRKTGYDVTVFLTPDMKIIIDSFAEIVADSPYVFPFIDGEQDQQDAYKHYTAALNKQNRLLKIIGKRAGIMHGFSTHAARHSWASFARNHGISLTVISAALGHRTETTTQIYLNQLDTGLIAKANMTISKLFST
jgi:integrase